MRDQWRIDGYPERYDDALRRGHHFRLAPDAPRPRPTRDWPPENVALLVRFGEWLEKGGASEYTSRAIYLPMAGHILGLALKPHPQIDLEVDLLPAMEYVKAKGARKEWTKLCYNGLMKFRRFLMHERGQVEVKARRYDPALHTEGLPAWVVTELTSYQHLCQRNWRDARLEENIQRFWSGHLRIWHFLCEQCGVQELDQVRRKQLFEYADQRLAVSSSVSTINADLRGFVGFMQFLQELGYSVPQALLRVHNLKQPERLPKFIPDDQVRLLRDDFNARLNLAQSASKRRDALLDCAFFYLLWQCGLRKGEVEELRLEDLDLAGHKLSVRNGKGMKDRTVFLTEATLNALRGYLAVRGPGPTDHVFLYRNQPLIKGLIHDRLKAAGERVGVKVHAHRLRHTTATQLLNAGCPVTSIQKFLGHKKLNTTMIYARAHDHTVEADYFAAMRRVEQRLELVAEPQEASPMVSEDERQQLLALAENLAEPDIDLPQRLEIVDRIRSLLNGKEATPPEPPDNENRKRLRDPPPSPAFLWG